MDNLRKWEKSGEALPARKTQGGTRYYDAAQLLGLSDSEAVTVGYARVSSHDQKADLARQQEMLEAYCAAKGWRCEIIQDLGFGMDYHKAGLLKLVEMILNRRVKRLVITHKDRLLRFGAELVFALCELQGIEIVITNQGERPSFEEELARDVLEIIPRPRPPRTQRFPSRKACPRCGQIHDMPLSARRMACGCGNGVDRGMNAARSLAEYAASPAVSACGVLSAGVAQAA